ncbi:MAG: oxygen-independent coproporphyrinogen III oxidase, partial [Spongiibacteraceae bacterium]
ITLRPDRISLYHYAHLPERFKSQRAIDRMTLPSSDDKVEMLSLAAQRLQDAGYIYIGMDHFALPSDELARCQREGRLLRNFQGYSTGSTADVIGLGVSAISAVGRQYAQNHKNIYDYYLQLEDGLLPVEQGLQLDDDDCLRRYIIMQLACNLQLDYRFFNLKFNTSFSEKFASLMPALLDMQRDGIVSLNKSGICITDKGRMLIRNICMLFDSYLNGSSTQYSKTL